MGFGVRRAGRLDAGALERRELVVLGRLGLFRGWLGISRGPGRSGALVPGRPGAAGRGRGGVWGWRRGSDAVVAGGAGGSAVTVGARIGATLVAGAPPSPVPSKATASMRTSTPRTSMSACRTCSVRPPLRKALRSPPVAVPSALVASPALLFSSSEV